MALSNRDRIGKLFEVIAPALDDYISSVIGAVDAARGDRSTLLSNDGDPRG